MIEFVACATSITSSSPDDVHESMLHSRWMYTWNRMNDFLKCFVWDRPVAAQSTPSL